MGDKAAEVTSHHQEWGRHSPVATSAGTEGSGWACQAQPAAAGSECPRGRGVGSGCASRDRTEKVTWVQRGSAPWLAGG